MDQDNEVLGKQLDPKRLEEGFDPVIEIFVCFICSSPWISFLRTTSPRTRMLWMPGWPSKRLNWLLNWRLLMSKSIMLLPRTTTTSWRVSRWSRRSTSTWVVLIFLLKTREWSFNVEDPSLKYPFYTVHSFIEFVVSLIDEQRPFHLCGAPSSFSSHQSR